MQENYVQYGLNINEKREYCRPHVSHKKEEGEQCENWGESSGGEKESECAGVRNVMEDAVFWLAQFDLTGRFWW